MSKKVYSKYIKTICKALEKVTKSFDDYSTIASVAKYASIHEKGYFSDLGREAKVSDRVRLKILTPKQMLQRLPIGLA